MILSYRSLSRYLFYMRCRIKYGMTRKMCGRVINLKQKSHPNRWLFLSVHLCAINKQHFIYLFVFSQQFVGLEVFYTSYPK